MQTVFGRKNKSAVSPVIGTILMVAITVVLAAVLYVMVAGLGPSNTNQPPTGVLTGGGSWTANSNGTSTTYTFTVTTVTPTSANINPTQLEYIISNSQSTPLYSGAANQSLSSGGFTINVLYQDSLGPNLVGAGDRIQIVVSPVANNPLVGGNMQVNFNGNSFVTGKM